MSSGHQTWLVVLLLATHSITWPRRFPKPELKLGKGWNEDDQGSFVNCQRGEFKTGARCKAGDFRAKKPDREEEEGRQKQGRQFGRQHDLPPLSGSQCSGLSLRFS